MEIITAATQLAKGEINSSKYFMLFGIAYLLVAVGMKQMGTTALLKSLVIPMLVAGGLLLMAGISFYFSNKAKLNSFEKNYKANPSAVITSELETTAKTIKTYQNVALKVFPMIILIASLLAIFVSSPMSRAICIAIIAFFSVLVLLDSQALKRMNAYQQQLEIENEVLKN